MLNDIFSYSNTFPSLDISATFSEMLETSSWKAVLRILKHEQLPLSSSQRKNQEQIIAGLQSFLLVQTWQRYPLQWAFAHATLGHVYSEIHYCINEQPETLDLAFDHYQQALEVITEENSPIQWAIIQQGLVLVAIMRQDHLKAEQLQQAITRGQSSLRILTRSAYPAEWAKVHAYLGEAYRQAAGYEELQELYSGQAVMQEQALRHIEAALQVYTIHDYHFEWTKVKNFEGMIYQERIRGKRSENRERARCCFRAASNSTVKK